MRIKILIPLQLNLDHDDLPFFLLPSERFFLFLPRCLLGVRGSPIAASTTERASKLGSLGFFFSFFSMPHHTEAHFPCHPSTISNHTSA